MKVVLHNRNVLDIEADTIAVSVDGSGPGLEGQVARQLMARLGADKMADLYAPPPYYPFNGTAFWSGLSTFDTQFQQVCCLGFLGHQPGDPHLPRMVSAFGMMLDEGGWDVDHGQVIACTLLTGGSRIKPVDAAYAMALEIEARPDTMVRELHLAELDAARFEVLQQVLGPYT